MMERMCSLLFCDWPDSQVLVLVLEWRMRRVCLAASGQSAWKCEGPRKRRKRREMLWVEIVHEAGRNGNRGVGQELPLR